MIALIVSVSVPVWLGLINIAFAAFSLIPFVNLFSFVTNKSSPTTWKSLFISFVKLIHESQSSSKKGSSIDLIDIF